ITAADAARQLNTAVVQPAVRKNFPQLLELDKQLANLIRSVAVMGKKQAWAPSGGLSQEVNTVDACVVVTVCDDPGAVGALRMTSNPDDELCVKSTNPVGLLEVSEKEEFMGRK